MSRDYFYLHPMKPFYTVLLLASLLLNSCVSTVHQYAARRALVADEVLELHTPIQDIWLVEDKFYACGYLGKGRGIQRGIPINSILYQAPESGFELTDPHPRKVFIELYHPYPGRETEKPERFSATARYQTSLPTQAKKVPVRQAFKPDATSAAIGTPCTDAHRYYAYPLAAILAIGIDLPASVAMTGALVPTLGIGAACAKISDICSQTHPTPLSDTPSAASDQAR